MKNIFDIFQNRSVISNTETINNIKLTFPIAIDKMSRLFELYNKRARSEHS